MKFLTKLSVRWKRKSRLFRRETISAANFYLSSTVENSLPFHGIPRGTEFARNNKVTARVLGAMCKCVCSLAVRSTVPFSRTPGNRLVLHKNRTSSYYRFRIRFVLEPSSRSSCADDLASRLRNRCFCTRHTANSDSILEKLQAFSRCNLIIRFLRLYNNMT